MRTGRRIRKLCKRWNDPHDAHELTFSCSQGKSFLRSEQTRTYLATAIDAARQKHTFDLWAYVIMPNHVHLLIWPREEQYDISAILKSVKQSVSRKAIVWLRRENPDGLAALETGHRHAPYRFWQDGGGYDRNMRSAPAIRKAIDYIHANPVRAELVGEPGAWEWSSYRQWCLGEAGPIAIDVESCNAALT